MVLLCRRFEIRERKRVSVIRGRCSIYYASRVSDFFVIFFLCAEDYAEDHAFRKEVIAKICKNVFVLLGY